MAPRARIAVIGGTGLYNMADARPIAELPVATPFGEPSDALRFVEIDGVPVVFLPRHGRGHRYTPSEVNYRANIWALKSVGAAYVIGVSACGSLREEIAPGHVVLIDQYIDRTRGTRADTFFGNGVVAHTAFADPICETLRRTLLTAARTADVPHHDRGTYLCMEGPAFSTRAESRMYRLWGADVIGMTNLPEAKLAREAELSYASLALATDYDAWRETEEHVDAAAVMQVLAANVQKAQAVIRAAVGPIAALGPSPYGNALDSALMTAEAAIPPATRERLALILGRVLDARRNA